MFSVILGWILIVLGILSYVGALIAFIKAQFAPAERAFPPIEDINLKGIAEILDKLATVMENFGKLSIPVQWALLGLANIGIGAILIANRPF